MPTLEIRRHSKRKDGGGSQLSQEGVELARTIGDTMGPFAVVATSVVPRARETAIAMGFAVDHEVVTLLADEAAYAENESNRWYQSDRPFKALAEIINADGPHGRYAHSIAALWRDLVGSLVGSQKALLVGHSGELEAALIACFPDADHASWGGAFAPCEGAQLTFAGEPARWRSVELIRR